MQVTPGWARGVLEKGAWQRERLGRVDWQGARTQGDSPESRPEAQEWKRSLWSWWLLHLQFATRQMHRNEWCLKDLICVPITVCFMKFIKNWRPSRTEHTQITHLHTRNQPWVCPRQRLPFPHTANQDLCPPDCCPAAPISVIGSNLHSPTDGSLTPPCPSRSLRPEQPSEMSWKSTPSFSHYLSYHFSLGLFPQPLLASLRCPLSAPIQPLDCDQGELSETQFGFRFWVRKMFLSVFLKILIRSWFYISSLWHGFVIKRWALLTPCIEYFGFVMAVKPAQPSMVATSHI